MSENEEFYDSSHIREQRIDLIEKMRAQGLEPYASNFDRTHNNLQARERYEFCEEYQFVTAGGNAQGVKTDPMRLAGRVVRYRAQGKLGFADIVDESGKIQIMARLNVLGADGMALYKQIDLGDFIGVEGTVVKSSSGEISVDVEHLQILTKAIRPLPDSFYGLKDPETRARQRHLDMIMNPEVVSTLKRRSQIISSIRRYLETKEFIEVETPVLQSVAGGAAARPFLTHHNALGQNLQLRIALELYLKRLIIGGIEKVFEIGRVFRNEGISSRHNPEFTLLELYQAYGDLEDMKKLTESMIRKLAIQLNGTASLNYQDQEISLEGVWNSVEMLELISRKFPALEIDDLPALQNKAAELGAIQPEILTWGTAVIEIFERAVEPTLVQPTFVTGYPVEVSPLARRRDGDDRLAERFELYIAGMEIANAFSELTDPVEQRLRFEQQIQMQQAGGTESHPMDTAFIEAMESGMPPTGGLGIGIDRLVALLTNSSTIKDVIAFPLLRALPD